MNFGKALFHSIHLGHIRTSRTPKKHISLTPNFNFVKKMSSNIPKPANLESTMISKGLGNPEYVIKGSSSLCFQEEETLFKNSHPWVSDCLPNSYVLVQYIQKKASICRYHIKITRVLGKEFLPKLWIVEGTNNLKDWELIDFKYVDLSTIQDSVIFCDCSPICNSYAWGSSDPCSTSNVEIIESNEYNQDTIIVIPDEEPKPPRGSCSRIHQFGPYSFIRLKLLLNYGNTFTLALEDFRIYSSR